MALAAGHAWSDARLHPVSIPVKKRLQSRKHGHVKDVAGGSDSLDLVDKGHANSTPVCQSKSINVHGKDISRGQKSKSSNHGERRRSVIAVTGLDAGLAQYPKFTNAAGSNLLKGKEFIGAALRAAAERKKEQLETLETAIRKIRQTTGITDPDMVSNSHQVFITKKSLLFCMLSLSLFFLKYTKSDIE